MRKVKIIEVSLIKGENTLFLKLKGLISVFRVLLSGLNMVSVKRWFLKKILM